MGPGACSRSDTGQPLETAGPSMPVEVLGFNGTPEAGDRLAVVDSEARAREVTDYRARQRRDKVAARATRDARLARANDDSAQKRRPQGIPLGDQGGRQGSLEAIAGALEKLGTSEVMARVLHASVGGITESDVTLAEASAR